MGRILVLGAGGLVGRHLVRLLEEREVPHDARPRSACDITQPSAVERAVRGDPTPRHFLLRVGCLYGHGGAGFGSTLLGRLRAGERVRADAERRVQPTWARAVADQALALAGGSEYGLYHATCHGETAWA